MICFKVGNKIQFRCFLCYGMVFANHATLP